MKSDGRCCLYALAGVDAAQGRRVGQQWGLPPAGHCDQYADMFANAAQEFVSNVTEKLIDSESISLALSQLSQAIENGRECEELGKYEVKVELGYQGCSHEFSFPCDLLLGQFGALLEKYESLDKVREWRANLGANFESIVKLCLEESANTYHHIFASDDHDSMDDRWIRESQCEVMRTNHGVGKGIWIDLADQLDWKDVNFLTKVKNLLRIGDQTQGVNPSILGQLGRIIWEYESQCYFLHHYFTNTKKVCQ